MMGAKPLGGVIAEPVSNPLACNYYIILWQCRLPITLCLSLLQAINFWQPSAILMTAPAMDMATRGLKWVITRGGECWWCRWRSLEGVIAGHSCAQLNHLWSKHCHPEFVRKEDYSKMCIELNHFFRLVVVCSLEGAAIIILSHTIIFFRNYSLHTLPINIKVTSSIQFMDFLVNWKFAFHIYLNIHHAREAYISQKQWISGKFPNGP